MDLVFGHDCAGWLICAFVSNLAILASHLVLELFPNETMPPPTSPGKQATLPPPASCFSLLTHRSDPRTPLLQVTSVSKKEPE